jgi:hypothetical protein
MGASYTVPRSQERAKSVADWLNPRRRLYAERLIGFLAWRGRKVYFTAVAYADAQHEIRGDIYTVNAAINDLHRLGCIEVHIAGDDIPVARLLDDEIDRLASPWGGRR